MNPLNLKIQDNEIRQQRIETDVLYPIHIADGKTGGSCRFVLKHRGFLDPDSRIILPATCNKCFISILAHWRHFFANKTGHFKNRGSCGSASRKRPFTYGATKFIKTL